MLRKRIAKWLRDLAQRLDRKSVTAEQVGLGEIRCDDVVLIFRGVDIKEPVGFTAIPNHSKFTGYYKVVK